MQQPRRGQAWSLSTVLSALTSLVCMGSMGAMGAAASVGAAATSSMAGMSTMATPAPSHIALTTQLFQSIGLGGLTQIPDDMLRPLFIILLIVGIIGSYLSYRVHGRKLPFLLTLLASVSLYLSIYLNPSDLLYYLSLIILILAAFWNARVHPQRSSEQPMAESIESSTAK